MLAHYAQLLLRKSRFRLDLLQQLSHKEGSALILRTFGLLGLVLLTYLLQLLVRYRHAVMCEDVGRKEEKAMYQPRQLALEAAYACSMVWEIALDIQSHAC